MTDIRIALEHPDQPEVVAMVEALDAYQATLYPPEACYRLDMAALSRPEVAFAVARDGQGAAVGCSAIVVGPEFGEVKRMWVDPSRRGGGVADQLLASLEAEARARGCRTLMLETGTLQPAALGFYARQGFARRGPYGEYPDDPFSIFMEKTLDD